jgi:Uma2 family endonuclease
MLEVPPGLLDERRRLDQDRLDEVWEGEIHLVPPADFHHNRMATVLSNGLEGPARAGGLVVTHDTGVWASDEEPESYRVPDVLVVDLARTSRRGVENLPGALLVVEIRSPRDETYAKLPFYDRVGVTEFVVVDRPEGVLRRWVRRGDALAEVTPVGGADAVSLDTLPGPVVRLMPDGDPGLAVDMR